MPYPQQNIPIGQLLNYLNTEWVTNGMGDITAIIGNNATNSLLQGIFGAPLNSTGVAIINTTASVQVANGVNYFYGSLPANVVFGDNFWNEWVFINSLNVPIPFGNGLGFFDLNFTFQNQIPARSLLRISKSINNDLWVQTGTYGASPAMLSIKWNKWKIIIGHPELSTTGAPIINSNVTVVTLPFAVQQNSETIFWQDQPVDPPPASSDMWVQAAYNGSNTTYTFSQTLTEYSKLYFQCVQLLSTTGSNQGLVPASFVITAPTSVITLPFLNTTSVVWFIIAGLTTYDQNSFTQNGISVTLPFTFSPQTITVVYLP